MDLSGIQLNQFLPVLIVLAVGLGVWFLFSLFAKKDDRTEDRLDKLTRIGAASTMAKSPSAESASDKFRSIIESVTSQMAPAMEPKSEEEKSQLKQYLANGGWRSEKAVSVYQGMCMISLLLGVILAGVFVVPRYGLNKDGLMYGFLVAGGLFYLPRIVVGMIVRKRKEQVTYGLPDALDLMVVCVESGLGLDAAMRKVCEEMGHTFPIISEEFSICNFQLQMGRPRREVLHELGWRTGVDDMKSMVAILIQADRFGSSIAQALRVQSDSMRVRRRQKAEERAAMTAVQLIFPLVLCIFPAIFIVLVGPAGIQVYDALQAMGGK